MRLLVIEDEDDLCRALEKGLQKSGYIVDTAADGECGLELSQLSTYDLIILDLNLPKLDGIGLLQQLRKADKQTPVLILSARTAVQQRILGLDEGANDYLVKPFDFGELSARVRSLLRRKFHQESTRIAFHGFIFDTVSRTVTFAGEESPLVLSPKELAILEYLLLRRGKPTTMEQLIGHVWQEDDSLFSNAAKVHVSTLRKKLAVHNPGEIITWMRSAGYIIREEETK